MTFRRIFSARHILVTLAVTAGLAATGVVTIGGFTASARTVHAQVKVSQNWAGYVVESSTGKSFSSVSGSWKQPSVKSSASSSQGYSAFWVGLGGAGSQSQALEQVGTSSDWVNGRAQYYAWYELVPSSEMKLNIAINAGDQISANVTVNGTNVTVSLSDQTTGQSVSKTLHMSAPDISSAEWIAEAPSSYVDGGSYQTLPLADFTKVTFSRSNATAGGHTGSIADSNWTVQKVQLSSGGAGFANAGPGFAGAGLGQAPGQASTGAETSTLSGDGASFAVTSVANSGNQASSGVSGALPGGYPDGGGPSDGYGYGPGGYAYPPGAYGGY